MNKRLTNKLTLRKKLTISQLTVLSIAGSILLVALLAGIRYKSVFALAISETVQPSQERYSELYFSKFQSLEHYLKNNQQTSYHYEISNHESIAKTYRYEVSLVHGQVVENISEGSVRLLDGQSSKQSLSITSKEPNTQYRLIIRLLDQHQEINLRLQS